MSEDAPSFPEMLAIALAIVIIVVVIAMVWNFNTIIYVMFSSLGVKSTGSIMGIVFSGVVMSLIIMVLFIAIYMLIAWLPHIIRRVVK